MVRIAHFADTHLGFRQYNLEEREQDFYDVMDEIAEKIVEERAEIVIHSGDLFDSPKPPAQAYYAFKKFLNKLEGKAKVFAVLGDHDTPKRRGMPPHKVFDDRIRILGLASGEHQTLNLKGEEVFIAGISHFGRRYRDLLIEELKKLETLVSKNSISILALHQAIDKFFSIEDVYELRVDEIPRNFKYYAMGRLHSRMLASFGNGTLAYSGSTEIIKSDEIADWEKSGKGFYIVDIGKEDVHVEKVNLERIRPQLRVRWDYKNFEEELEKFLNTIEDYKKLPIVHATVEGREVDRQKVQQVLNQFLAKRVLHFRSKIIEETEREFFEMKTGEMNIRALLREYFENEKISEFAYELFKALRIGDIEEAKKIAEDYLRGLRQNDVEKSSP